MSRWTYLMTIGMSVVLLQGCFQIIGAGAGAAIANVDPKAPKAETSANCESWECWDGYACGACDGNATPIERSTPKK
ncbi:MAG: hypothetical protein EOO73_05650 [Myxococcales bacterium]|nr:MAG: hypothetical protein EOO73_05650 [Myxococcales bacterium]